MLKCGSVTFEPSPTGEQMMVMNGDRDYVTNDSIAVTPRVSVHGTADDDASPSSPIHSNNSSSSRPTHGTETTLVSSPKQRQPSTTTKVTACSTTTSGASGDKIYTDTDGGGGGGAQAGDSSGSSGSLVTKIFERRSFSFLRVADLEMDETITMASVTSDETTVGATSGGSTTSTSSNGSSDLNMTAAELINNIHHASVDPPPGVDHDPKERWIAFTTDRDGSHAPIAPYAMDRLANFGLTTSLNETMWNPADNKTSALIKNGQVGVDWFASTFKPGKIKPCPGLDTNDAVMVWSGSFIHGLYGSDLPAIRAAGIVNMSARSLFDLLVDSTRVKEYNKLSLGRKDLVTFEGDLDTAGPFGRTITKVMRSETKPPMIRKTLVFESILHAKELVDGSGYLIVTRAIHHPGDDSSDHSLTSVIKSEILMGVNLIRKVEGQEDSRCCMINVNHIRSPMVPMMVAKRIGISSAVGFMNDVRALC
jgi:hypothetical protein